MIADIDKSLEFSSHYYRPQHSSTDGNELPKKSRSRPSDPIQTDFIAQTQRVVESFRHSKEQLDEEDEEDYLQFRHEESTKVGAKKRKAVENGATNAKKEKWEFHDRQHTFEEEFVNTENKEDETELDTPVAALIEGVKSPAIDKEQNISTASTAELVSAVGSTSSQDNVSVNSQEEMGAYFSFYQPPPKQETESLHALSISLPSSPSSTPSSF
jgi:hypothetical protein